MLGISSSLVKGGASLLTFVKDNLKLYLDFKSNKSDTLKFPSEGSTEFDGSNDIIDISGFQALQDFTLSCWVYLDAFSVVIWGDSANQNWLRINSATQVGIKLNNNGYDINHGLTFTTGEWQHFAITRDSNNVITVYRNGVAGGTTLTNHNTFTPSIIGKKGTSDNFFNGKMANNAVWSRALEPEEIQSIQNKSYSQLKGVEKTPSLVAWWALDSTVSIEKITNGDFSAWTGDNPDGWSVSTDLGGGVESDNVKVTEDANGARIFTTGTNINLRQNSVMIVGRTYEVIIVIHSATSGDVKTTGLSSNITNINASGTYTVTTTASSTTFNIKRNTACDIVVSSVSVKEVQTPDSLENNNGAIIGATTTTSVYAGNAPILPRAVDVAKEGQADAIGDGSASFNGSSDHISINNLPLTATGTFTAWINTTDDNGGTIFNVSDENANTQFTIVIGNNGTGTLTNEIVTIGRTSSGTFDRYGYTTSTRTELIDGNWHHLAVTGDGSAYKIYIDGISKTVSEGASNLGTNGDWTGGLSNIDTFEIGRYNSDNVKQLYYHDNLSQVGIWAGALTQAQIQSVMESTSYSKIPSSVKSTLGAERVLNSDFSDGGNLWTLTDASVVNGVLDVDIGAFTYYASQSTDSGGSNYRQFESGYLMKIEIVVDEYTSGGTIVYATGNNIGTFNSAGTHTIYYKPSASEYLILRSDGGGFEGKISSVSIKRVTNDIVAYYPLDGDSSRGNGTDDVTTGEVLGSEKITNGGFDADSDWTKSSVTISGGKAVFTNGGSTALYQDIGSSLTGLYKISFDLTDYTSGTLKVYGGGQDSFSDADLLSFTSTGSYVQYIELVGSFNGNIIFGGGAFNGSIDNVSVKEVTSNTGVLK